MRVEIIGVYLDLIVYSLVSHSIFGALGVAPCIIIYSLCQKQFEHYSELFSNCFWHRESPIRILEFDAG